MTDDDTAKHTYPVGCAPGAHWATDEVWRCLDKLKPGLLTEEVRAYIAGFMAGALMAERAKAEALQRVFEQGEADSKRAVERWRAKHPDRADEWPEKTDLLVFVMEQLDEVEAGEDFFMSAKLRTPRDPM